MATHSSILAWEIHGQRSLVGCSPCGHKESDTTDGLSTSPWWLGEIQVYSVNELTRVMAFDLGAGYSRR